MAKTNHGAARFGHCMVFLIVFAHLLLNNEFVEARNRELVKHRGTIETIKSEDGEVIDCVDIYKQPAFDHPLLKNHTIEMEPSFYPTQMDPQNSQPQMTQSLLKHVQCPLGTIPITRHHKLDYYGHTGGRTRIPQRSYPTPLDPDYSAHEYAQVTETGGVYLGAQARINVWNPKTEDNELSVSQIWLISGDGSNTLEAGWIVLPSHFDDKATRFFVYWTRDNYQLTGCFNLDCPGFVQTSNSSILGGLITPISTLNSNQYDILVSIYKNTKTGSWWLMVDNQVIGYWPDSILTTIVDGASIVNWGGEVLNSKAELRHTTTQMGSGHFPSEGYGKSSYFHNLKVIDGHGNLVDADNLKTYVSNPSCYELSIDTNNQTKFGTHFYYGGPGFSDKCRDGGASSRVGGTSSSVGGKRSLSVFLIISALIVVLCAFV